MSVGHLARLLEEAGLPTVIIAVKAFQPVLEAMKVPRAVITRNPMGRTLGPPGDRERQRGVILAALRLLAEAKQGGAVVELPESYRILSFTVPAGDR